MGSRSTEALLGKFLNRLENCFQVFFYKCANTSFLKKEYYIYYVGE